MARIAGQWINDDDRADWVANDEGLYDMMRRSRLSEAAWIRAHRAEIDAVIRNVLTSAKPAHYLKYGG